MAEKFVTEDNFKNIMNGIQGKVPKELEVNINTNINRVKVELLDSSVTLTVNSWGAVNLNRPMTDFDEVEFEYRPKFGVNTQFRKFSVLNSSLLDMTSDGRCMDSFTMEAGVTNNVINQYVGIIMRISSNDYQNPEFFTRFGGALSSATIELAAVRGINYTQSYGDTPIGTIISYMGITPPDEYLSCDGTTYNIKDYWELAEFIKSQFGTYNYFGGDGTTTFAVPDLRGEFLRGTGTNSHANQGSGTTVGTHQNATTVPTMYTTGTSPDGFGMWTTGTGTQMLVNNADGGSATAHYAYISLDGKGAQAESTGLKNVRPTNTSVLYCIKYTNSPSMQPSNVYSTEEKRIGTWIDGKPLYQIALTGRTPSTADTNVNMIDITSLNIDQVIELNGFITYDAGGGLIVNVPINSPRVTNNTHYTWFYIGEMMSGGNKVNHIKGQAGTNLINQPVHFVLKYTKK